LVRPAGAARERASGHGALAAEYEAGAEFANS
jgi:hypothetical protein